MGTFVLWGVIGALGAVAVASGVVAWWFDPEREGRKRKRRAKANQRWVRKAMIRHGVNVEEEARQIAQAYEEMNDPWKHLDK